MRAACLAVWISLLCPVWAAVNHTAAGLEHFYNLEYDEAIAEFRRSIAVDPNSPENYNHLAMAILYREMLRTGALESELVSGTNPFLRRPKMQPSPQDEAEFHQAISKSINLSENLIKKNQKDARAFYTLGVAYGLRANYNFLVRKAYMDSLRDATTARKLHDKVTDLDASNYDARLIQGVHDYVVGSLPWHIKMLGFLIGFRGDKQEGIRTLEAVAARGDQNRVDAEILLCAVYRRERMPAKAAALLEDLIRRFPRNYLLRFELAQMYSDLGDGKRALEVIQKIEELKRSGEPGYRNLPPEKIFYARGTIQFWYRELEQALDNFNRVVSRSDELDLNTSTFAWLRLGQIYDLKGQRSKASEAYHQVLKMAPDSDAARQARRYLSEPYRRSTSGG